jgi:hypothetical protein
VCNSKCWNDKNIVMRSRSVWRWCINVSGHYPLFCSLQACIRSTNAAGLKVCSTCIRGRPQNMLQRNEGLADSTKHHSQKIQGISPSVSGRPSDQSTQLGHLSHLHFPYQKTTHNSVQCRLTGKIVFLCLYRTENLSNRTSVVHPVALHSND